MSDSFDIITVQEFLRKYNNWNSTIQRTAEGESYLYCPFVSADDHVVFLIFKFTGDFLMVASVDFLHIKKSDAYQELFLLNDKLKLVKLFQSQHENDFVDIGFEVIKEIFSYELFETFMDMLCVSLDNVIANVRSIKNVSIEHLKHLDAEGKIV